MNTRRIVVLAACLLCLSACGVRSVVGAPAAAPVHAGPLGPADANPLFDLDFTRAIHTPTLMCDGPVFNGTLTLPILLGSDQEAAIVTVDGKGMARWNTPDGHRWTQAEAEAARASSHGTFQPYLNTPWLLHLSGPVLRGTLPQAITAWTSGGDVGQDHLSGCGVGIEPVAGRTYLAEFAQNLTVGTGEHSGPILMWLSSYDPGTKTLHTRFGALTLP